MGARLFVVDSVGAGAAAVRPDFLVEAGGTACLAFLGAIVCMRKNKVLNDERSDVEMSEE